MMFALEACASFGRFIHYWEEYVQCCPPLITLIIRHSSTIVKVKLMILHLMFCWFLFFYQIVLFFYIIQNISKGENLWPFIQTKCKNISEAFWDHHIWNKELFCRTSFLTFLCETRCFARSKCFARSDVYLTRATCQPLIQWAIRAPMDSWD